jgi:Mrp family chromosome partitioning ATPase
LYSQQLSRLQVLSTISSPAQVATPASLPSAPTSPRPVRDGLLAAAFGLVLGLLIAYVRESFDRRLRTVHDVEQELSLPMLGHVRQDALGQSPRVNGSRGVSEVDWELFRIMRRNLDFLDERDTARVVAVTSPLPEEGKSTVAGFLAFVSAAAGKRTLLVECDLRRPVFAERLGINRAPGLSDFLLGEARPDQILQVIKFGDPMSMNGDRLGAANGASSGSETPDVARLHMHELVCITAGTSTRHPVELLRSDALQRMLGEVANAYDLVVLDTPPMLSVVDTLELLPEVDAALVCVRVHKTTRSQAKAGMAALSRLPTRPTGVVITGTRPAKDVEYGYYGYYS